MSLYKDASLVMIPSAYKDGKLYSIRPTDGSGDFTFSRGSNLAATRVDVNGLIEKGRENLVLYSNNLDQAIWGKAQLSITSGEVGYDGGNNAFKITPNTNNITHYIYKSNTELNVLNTLSVYAKYSGYHAQLRAFNIGSGHAYANFDLQNGTKGTSGGDSIIDSTITGVGNGWYRITLTLNYGSAYSIGLIPIETPTIGEIPAYAGDGTSGVIIQDFQGEAGLVATDYIETGASTAQAGILEDMPRLDYSGSCPALLLEPQRTNVLEQSEYYNAYFTRNNVSLTDNATTSTEGLQNASKLIPDNGTGGNRSVGKTFSGLSGIHTFSVFAKAAEYGYVSLRMRNAPSNFVMFDLSDGSVYNTNSSGNQYVDNSAKVEDYGNGWYRLSASYDPSESETAGTLYPSLSVGITGDETSSFNGDGTSGIYIYGMQFEAGSYPTSYIPTYGSSVTRSDDFMNISSLADEIDGNSFTYFLEVNNEAVVRDASTGNISVGATGNRFFLYNSNTASNRLQLFIQDSGGIEQYVLSADNVKIAIRFEPNNVEVFENGVSVLSTTQNLDFSANSAYVLRGTTREIGIKQTAIFPTALTDSECIALTTL